MKNNDKNYFLLVFLALTLQSCSLNEGELWGLGSYVFLIFLAILALNKVIPVIQEQQKIKTLIEYSKPILLKLFFLLTFLSIVLIGIGAFLIVTNEERSSVDLIFFIGIILLYFSINMRDWIKENSALKKRNYIKLMGLSVSFIFIMVYILTGASGFSL